MAGMSWLRLSLLAAAWLLIVLSVAPITSANDVAQAMFGYVEVSHSDRAQSAALKVEAIQSIAQRYGITLADRTERWSLDEVLSVQRALAAMENRFAGLADRDAERAFRLLFQDVAFYRDQAYRNNIAYAIGGTIGFYDTWARLDDTARAFYLAHELGHIWDTRTSALHLTMGEISQEFAENVGAFVDEKGRYQLGGEFPGWDAGRGLRHRADSAAEDWAESLASVMVPEFESSVRNIGRARFTEVQRLVNEWMTYAEARIGRSARSWD
jgi:hypothetical protein